MNETTDKMITQPCYPKQGYNKDNTIILLDLLEVLKTD